MSDNKFDPRKHLTNLSGQDYLEVRWRMVWFRDEHPNGQISTEIIEVSDEYARAKATVRYPYDLNGVTEWASADGHGSAKNNPQNKRGGDRFVERAETAAIGRALAGLGYGTQFADDFDDIADAPSTPRPERKQSAPAERSSEPPGDGPAMISDKQVKFISTLAKEAGYNDDNIKTWLKVSYKVDSRKELTKEQASDFINHLQADLLTARMKAATTEEELNEVAADVKEKKISGQPLMELRTLYQNRHAEVTSSGDDAELDEAFAASQAEMA